MMRSNPTATTITTTHNRDIPSSLFNDRAEIHVTIKCCIPYDRYQLHELGAEVGLSLCDFLRFDPFLFPGYQHKHTSCGKTARVVMCGTFIFADPPQPGHSPIALQNSLQAFKQTLFRCEICDLYFNGPVTLQAHLDSRKHHNKLQQTAMELHQRGDHEGAAKLFEMVNLEVPEELLPQRDELPEIPEELLCQDGRGYNCALCDLSFTGPIPLRIHLVSKKHKKKIEANNCYYCSSCDMVLNGPGQWDQHVGGKKHLQNTGQLPSDELLEAAPLTSKTKGVPFTCDVCRIICNDIGQLEAHYRGKSHKSRSFLLETKQKTQLQAELSPASQSQSQTTSSQLNQQAPANKKPAKFKLNPLAKFVCCLSYLVLFDILLWN